MNPYKTLLFLARLGLILVLSQSAQPVAAQAEADLSLTVRVDRTRVKIGENVTYTITLTNLGSAEAMNVVFGDSLPDSLNWVSFSCSAGVTEPASCSLASLASGATVTAILVATPIPYLSKQERSTDVFFSAQADTPDPNRSNNSVLVSVRIIGKLPPY
jgi:uncharacterized repeat protein (TIGR01451 family)